jgi:hypothetical protein
MKKNTGLLAILLIHASIFVHAQTINRVEYFFNADPGFGNGTSVALTPAADIVNLPFTADISSLPAGIHHFYLRSQRSDGVWSITNNWLFLKSGTISSATINRLEYFFDNDPGFGNGVPVTITPASNISDFAFAVDIAALSTGMHRLFLRSAGNDGNWSILNSWQFFKSGQFSPVTINRLEYFFDTDPGFGNGTSVTITPAVTINDFSFNAGIGSLGLGLHTLFLRTQSNDGSWSQTAQWLFYKASLAGAGNLTALEYFFDTDPGFGNGTPLTIASSADLSDLSFDLDVSGIGNGTHRLFIRSRDAAGNWSISNVVEFDRLFPLPVNWLSFIAEGRNAQVFLEWRTDNQENCDHYDVEYSTNGTTYRNLVTIPSQSGTGVHIYTHLHEQPNTNGINYYRIRQVDIDGHFTYSQTRIINMSEGFFARLSPNPASDFVEINVSENNLTERLFDLSGRQVQTGLLNNGTNRIDLTGLASGSYLLVIEKQGRVLQTLKMVKR